MPAMAPEELDELVLEELELELEELELELDEDLPELDELELVELELELEELEESGAGSLEQPVDEKKTPSSRIESSARIDITHGCNWMAKFLIVLQYVNLN